jgi:hypothetical protein
MRVRNMTTCALGLAAALTLSSDLAAQDTTRLRRPSDQRITISKGAVEVPPRVDTVYVTRYDTVRVDNTIVRVDTVTVATPAPVLPVKVKGNMYWGMFAGTTWPYGNIDRIYTNGFHGGGVLGWERQDGFFGLRLDGAMSQIGRENMGPAFSTTQIGSGTPLMLHLAADLKVKPLNFGGWALYAIGGLNYNRYKRIALAAEGTTVSSGSCDFTVRGACYTNANNNSWSDKFGFNFGTGLDFHIGSQDMFLEARYIAIPANGARSWTLPVSLGVRYF